MTLILTELTTAGIVMVADSAITFPKPDGTISAKRVQWEKLFRVARLPSFLAGVSYWGFIGKVTLREFPSWLRERLGDGQPFSDLPSLAEHLSRQLNAECGDKPLKDGEDVGLHVAGFSPWTDGVARPTVFHVHNAHSHVETRTLLYDFRDSPAIRQQQLKSGSMGLFEARQNFPDLNRSLAENLRVLEGGFLLRNGDYGPYAVVSQKLDEAFQDLNTIAGCQIPRSPEEVASRMAFHRMVMETIIRIYAASSLPKRIAAPVRSLGITADQFVLGSDARL